MLRRITPFLWALMLALPLAACGTTTQYDTTTEATFATWDVDRNRVLDRDEWRTGFARTAVWTDWDLDRDDYLDDDELATGTFGMWDADTDTFMDENEWREAQAWIAERSDVRYAMAKSFEDLDVNRDRRLDTAEWTAGFDQATWTAWDTNRDRRLTRDEWADTVYEMWDEDRDDRLDETEWRAGYDDWT